MLWEWEGHEQIHQLETISEAFIVNPNDLFNTLEVDAEYEIYLAVVSESSIGLMNVQSPDIPVIRLQHLLKAMEQTDDLRNIAQWLYNRDFLPIIGKHYEIIDFNDIVGSYNITWYGLKTLIEGDYTMASLPPE